MAKWQTLGWISKEIENLKKQDAFDNYEKGNYVEISDETKKGVFYSIDCKGLEHLSSMFEVRRRHWKRLETAFLNAGYEIKRASRL